MNRFGLFVAVCFVAASSVPAFAQATNQQVADEIIGIVKAEWAASRQKSLADEGKNIAEECTQFTAEAATRLEGKALLIRLSEAGNKDPGTRIADEMLNPKVQIYGDTAVISYNFFGLTQEKDGKVKPGRAKSTRVYVKQGGKWMLVHANFASDPLPKD